MNIIDFITSKLPTNTGIFRTRIRLINKSGRNNRYTIICAPPDKTDSEVFSNVLMSAKVPRGCDEVFIVKNLYKAIHGYYDGDTPGHGGSMSTSADRPIKVGSSIQYQTPPGGERPQFSDDITSLDNNSKVIQIKAGTGWAKEDRRFVGISKAIGDDTEFARAVTIIAEENHVYDIPTNNCYYIFVGDFRKGVMIDLREISQDRFLIDFDKLGKEDVRVVHYGGDEYIIE